MGKKKAVAKTWLTIIDLMQKEADKICMGQDIWRHKTEAERRIALLALHRLSVNIEEEVTKCTTKLK